MRTYLRLNRILRENSSVNQVYVRLVEKGFRVNAVLVRHHLKQVGDLLYNKISWLWGHHEILERIRLSISRKFYPWTWLGWLLSARNIFEKLSFGYVSLFWFVSGQIHGWKEELGRKNLMQKILGTDDKTGAGKMVI